MGEKLWGEKWDSSLSPEYYIIPKYIIVSDLIDSSNLDKVKKGLRKLLIKQHSNKYFFVPDNTQDDIDKLRSYEPGAHFFSSIGWIDFNNYRDLKDMVENVQVSIMNLNDSYFQLVLRIKLSDVESNKLKKIISSNYYSNDSHLVESFTGKKWKQPKNKSEDEIQQLRRNGRPGGRTRVVKSFGNGILKTEVLDKEYDAIKYNVFSVLSKCFDFELFARKIVQPAYIIYASNIDSFDNIGRQFLDSMGIQGGDGKDAPSVPAFFKDHPNEDTLGYEHTFDFETDKYIIYFEKRVKQSSVYENPEHQIVSIFSDLYRTFSRYDYKGYLYYEYRDSIISFRDEISQVKENGRSYKKILKIRSQFYKEINFYQDISKIGNAYKGEIKNADSLPWIGRFRICGICSYYMDRSINRLNTYYNSVRHEINEKTELCKDLSDKRQISKSNVVSLIALIVAALTLIVTIDGNGVKQIINSLQTFISGFL